MSERHLHAVPGERLTWDDILWRIDFWNGVEVDELSIDVQYGDDDPGTDVVLDTNGWVLRHKYSNPRESTEEERAAVGWTW